MQLQRAFPGVEDPAEMMTEMPGHVLDRDFRYEIEVKLGPHPGQPARQDLRTIVGRLAGQVVRDTAVGELRQTGQVVRGAAGANLRRITQACRFAFRRAATMASSALPTTTSS